MPRGVSPPTLEGGDRAGYLLAPAISSAVVVSMVWRLLLAWHQVMPYCEGMTTTAAVDLTPVKGRDMCAGKASVYRNLNARSVAQQWSVKAADGAHKGLKVAEGEAVVITDAVAFVRLSAQQRIADGAAREVHAWITGTLTDGAVTVTDMRVITYRPRERGSFYYVDNGEAFTGADVVVFGTDGKAYAATRA